MLLYRAVPKNSFVEGEAIGRNTGRRLPGNVSYLADNLWEFTRPGNKPSRRSAVYASPTPELALSNAAAYAPDGYVACRIVFAREPAIYQLPVKDAREHTDIGKLQKSVNRTLGDWSDATIEEKIHLAALFLPGISKEELQGAMERSALLRSVMERAAAEVTFWSADPAAVDPTGELFFELVDGNTYTLHAV